MEYISNKAGISLQNQVFFKSPSLGLEAMQIQKYDKNVGEFKLHVDYECNFTAKKVRQLTYIWYLNDIVDGGETEFWANHRIKPTTGKLIIFPSHWTYPHKGLVPKSDDKYIITGWLYQYY